MSDGTWIRDGLLPFPSAVERGRIADALGLLDCRLINEWVQPAKLRTHGHGLLDHVLTGRVRVTLPTAEAASR